eukprot:g3687.t1
MKRDVYMGACEALPLKRSRDEIAKVEEEIKKCKKRRKLINWKLPSNRMLMEKAVCEVLSTGKSTYVSKKYKIPLRTLRRYTAAERRRLKCLTEVVESPQDFFCQEHASDEELKDFLVSWFVLENDVVSSKKNQEWEFVPISRVL